MNAGVLLGELRRRDVRLVADGLPLHVDAPLGTVTEEMREEIRGHKRALIRSLQRERRKLEEAGRRGLLIKWSREPGYFSVHDPTSGEWHELAAFDCPQWVLDDARARRRRGTRT